MQPLETSCPDRISKTTAILESKTKSDTSLDSLQRFTLRLKSDANYSNPVTLDSVICTNCIYLNLH